MKRIGIFIAVPVLLSALETVNLIKDHSFDKDSDFWAMRAGSQWADVGEDSAFASKHYSENSFDGEFASFGNTEREPAWMLTGGFDSAMIVYSFSGKKIEDLDSLIWHQQTYWKDNTFGLSGIFVVGFFLNASSIDWYKWGYSFENPEFNFTTTDRWQFVKSDMPSESTWIKYMKDLETDLASGHDKDDSVDSLLLLNWGFWQSEYHWYGQKVYWDDIRLMGYADYDVGVKEILSGDSLEKDTPYTPVARIKNFGRENASDFSVIAEIFEGETRLYYDSLPWSLTSDTEDTVTFAAFTPSSAANHTLTVRTSMSPDESDEDDEITKTLFGSGIEESVTPLDGLKLDVAGTSRGVLKVSFETPNGQVANLTVYDASGRIVKRLQVQGSGQESLRPALASGVYFVRLETGEMTLTRKALIVR